VNKVKLTASQRRQMQIALRKAHGARLHRRLLAVLASDRGATISEIADWLCVSCQSVYNWIARFQEQGDPAQLSDAPRSGRPALAGAAVDVLLRALLMLPPERFGYHATHWTVPLLQDQLRQNMAEEYSSDTVRRSLHRLGYVWKRPRYILAPDPEREKKTPNSPHPVWIAKAQRGTG
jgi:transposase